MNPCTMRRRCRFAFIATCLLALFPAIAGTNIVTISPYDGRLEMVSKINRTFRQLETVATSGVPVVTNSGIGPTGGVFDTSAELIWGDGATIASYGDGTKIQAPNTLNIYGHFGSVSGTFNEDPQLFTWNSDTYQVVFLAALYGNAVGLTNVRGTVGVTTNRSIASITNLVISNGLITAVQP